MPGRSKEGARVSKLYKLKMQGRYTESPEEEVKEELKVEEVSEEASEEASEEE